MGPRTSRPCSTFSGHDPSAEDREKLCQPRGMRRPGWRGNQVAVGHGVGHSQVHERASGARDIGRDSRVTAAAAPLENARRGENLRGVTNRGDGLVGAYEVANDFKDARIQANVFRSAAAGKKQSVVGVGLNVVERGVESEVVAAFFAVGLIAFEVVDRGANELAGFLSGAAGVNLMADHEKRLEWHHHFIVFNVVTHETENQFLWHRSLLWRR